jgi:Tol biopolymer transport system component/predicted Ser/Thr protein kinase
MPLSGGTRLGHYEILEKIGAGGMGEVYRAHDTRLGRDVAIKVSAERFGERFEREARVIASLNHPNICTLFDVGPNYLVMELVEGPTLAERIKEGAIPLEEALAISRQIADALEAAHEKGVVHRDLKPGNVKIKPDGAVKVLDFGLAKVAPASAGDSKDEASATVTMGQTQAGVILGTAAYMSPEQAKGKNVDKRADIWAFGVVLYEMLTGRQLFEGETLSETLASVMKEEPAWDRVPSRVLKLLRACLQKDPRQRLHDIADAKLLLEESVGPAISSPAKAILSPAIAAVLFLALGILSFVHFRETPPVAHATRFQVPLPEKGEFGGRLTLSPDGRRLAFNTTGPEGGVWVRDLNSLETRLLPGTQNAFSQFWSPDSRFLAFGVGNQLKKVDASGGPPQTLCESPTPVGSGAWNQDGVIIFGGAGNGPLRRVSAAGGVAADLTVLDASRGEAFHALPYFLPDGRHFVYYQGSTLENTGTFAGSLDAKPQEQNRERLLANRLIAVYAAGRLFFMRENTLMAQTFDAAKLKLVGEPVPVAEGVGTVAANGIFSVSANGAVLAYRTGGFANNRQLTWFDRQGKVLGTAGEPGPHAALSLSPDGTRAAILRASGGVPGDIWLHDFARGVSTRFTFDQTATAGIGGKGPVWSQDGSRIVFRASRRAVGDLYEKASNGAGEEAPLLQSVEPKEPNDWSRDGRLLLYSEVTPKTSSDLMVLPLGGDRKPFALLRTPFAEGHGSFSPDTHWFAYASNESGSAEIYVQPFTPPGSGSPPAAGKWQVSRDGGTRPKWRADGKEIFFRALNGSPMAVDVTTSSTFQAGIPKQLFALPVNVGDWDVTADGKRFLVAMPLQAQQNANTPITVVLNWEAGLKP